jgi:hypothetical protein
MFWVQLINIVKTLSFSVQVRPTITILSYVTLVLNLPLATLLTQIIKFFKEAGPRRVKIGQMKWAKLNGSFDKLHVFSTWKIWHI